MENAQKILKKSKSLEKKIEEYEMVKNKFEDILVLFDFASQDSSFEEELSKEIDHLENITDSLSTSIMLMDNMMQNMRFYLCTLVQVGLMLKIGLRCY